MTNEHHTAKKRKPAGPAPLPFGPGDDMTHDEQLAFEGPMVDGTEHEDDDARLTKSGRLNLDQVKHAIEESDKDDKDA